ncbi:hypothetical protein ACFE04_011143 [Oxalis oulophora]
MGCVRSTVEVIDRRAPSRAFSTENLSSTAGTAGEFFKINWLTSARKLNITEGGCVMVHIISASNILRGKGGEEKMNMLQGSTKPTNACFHTNAPLVGLYKRPSRKSKLCPHVGNDAVACVGNNSIFVGFVPSSGIVS